MSNVLIGIIGVILFIGMALAGASYLGPQFKTSRASSVASAMMSQTAQVAQAQQMASLRLGQKFEGAPVALVPRFLKSVPVNASGAGLHEFIFVNADGTRFNGSDQYMILVGIHADSDEANGDTALTRDICMAAAKFSHMDVSNGIPSYPTPQSIPTAAGCWKPSQENGGIRARYYYIFQKI